MVVELAEEVVCIPGEEQIGDEGGCGDTHGNADALADEVPSEGDVGGGDEEAETSRNSGMVKTRVVVCGDVWRGAGAGWKGVGVKARTEWEGLAAGSRGV